MVLNYGKESVSGADSAECKSNREPSVPGFSNGVSVVSKIPTQKRLERRATAARWSCVSRSKRFEWVATSLHSLPTRCVESGYRWWNERLPLFLIDKKIDYSQWNVVASLIVWLVWFGNVKVKNEQRSVLCVGSLNAYPDKAQNA